MAEIETQKICQEHACPFSACPAGSHEVADDEQGKDTVYIEDIIDYGETDPKKIEGIYRIIKEQAAHYLAEGSPVCIPYGCDGTPQDLSGVPKKRDGSETFVEMNPNGRVSRIYNIDSLPTTPEERKHFQPRPYETLEEARLRESSNGGTESPYIQFIQEIWNMVDELLEKSK